MFKSFIDEAEQIYKGKMFLTLNDVTALLGCEDKVIYNWTRRVDPKKRPPKIFVGKELRFPKRDFLQWLIENNSIG